MKAGYAALGAGMLVVGMTLGLFIALSPLI